MLTSGGAAAHQLQPVHILRPLQISDCDPDMGWISTLTKGPSGPFDSAGSSCVSKYFAKKIVKKYSRNITLSPRHDYLASPDQHSILSFSQNQILKFTFDLNTDHRQRGSMVSESIAKSRFNRRFDQTLVLQLGPKPWRILCLANSS